MVAPLTPLREATRYAHPLRLATRYAHPSARGYTLQVFTPSVSLIIADPRLAEGVDLSPH